MQSHTTEIRDGIMRYFKDHPAGYTKTTELQKVIGKNLSDTGHAARGLVKKRILVRQRVVGSNQYEYAAGPRLEWGLRHLGIKFPYHQTSRKRRRAAKREDAPAVSTAAAPKAVKPELKEPSAGAGMVLRFNGQGYAIPLTEARSIYEDLKALFGK